MYATLAVAILGIVGTLTATIVTQWMTGRREDRRWIQERDNEVRRWNWERSERQQQWDREDASRWQRDRLALYTALLLDLDSWRRLAQEGHLMTAQSREKLRDLNNEIRKSVYTAQLLGSDEVVSAVTDVWMKVAGSSPPASPAETANRRWSEHVHAVQISRGELEQRMRAELRITDIAHG